MPGAFGGRTCLNAGAFKLPPETLLFDGDDPTEGRRKEKMRIVIAPNCGHLRLAGR